MENNLRTLDVHGLDRTLAIAETKIFIEENIKLGNKEFGIMHGKGLNILRDAIYEYLKHDKRIKDFHLSGINTGVTIVYLV